MPIAAQATTTQPLYTERDSSISTSPLADNTSTPVDMHEVCTRAGMYSSVAASGAWAASMSIPAMASPCGQVAMVAGAISCVTCYVGNLYDPSPEGQPYEQIHAADPEAEIAPNFVMTVVAQMGPANVNTPLLQMPEARLIPTVVATPLYLG